MTSTSLIILALIINKINAHSWTRCTNYAAEITGGDYNEGQCNGWIRDWTFDGIDFGQDRGIDHQKAVGSGGSICPSSLDSTADTDYSSDYANSAQITRYTAGSTIRVVWPAKNHANYECFNYVPDTSMKLFMNSNTNPTSDLPNNNGDMLSNGYRLVKDWQQGCTAGDDGCGFQNCPKFCENTDRATCFGDFVVPNDVTSGYYTFVWYWIFNPGTPYISCWEAYIDSSAAPTTPNNPSSGDPNAGSSINGYLTAMPVCVTGQSYSETIVEGFVALEFGDVATREEISIIDIEEGINKYNFTAQFDHDKRHGEISAITDIAQEQFCGDFIVFYGDGTTCDICGDITTIATYEKGKAYWNTPYFVIIASLLAIVVS